ncbi:MAG TPA: type II secretion system protein [Candidatus Eremiobacteraceae bacterium]|nr:type II secretion system protein [Candidatus Eremiobacteraceae bacterium]
MKKFQRGETVIEMLVSLGVVAIILSMTTALYIQLFNHFQKVSTDVNAQSEARFAIGRAAQALRQAMTDPNQANQIPIISPTPLATGTPPSSNDVRFQVASNMPSDADFTALTYQNEEITTSSTGVAAGENPNLVLNVWNSAWTSITSTSIIGRDVENFQVIPVTAWIYDLQITVVPPYGMSMAQQSSTPTSSFTVNSRVYISYYQPN